MKMGTLLIFLGCISAVSIFAMESEEQKMSPQEIERLMEKQEDVERLARYKRPWKEETPEEKAANREQQITFLKASANYQDLPDELKLHALSFLVTAPGADKAEQLRNAAHNIRTVMRVNKDSDRLLNDEATNGNVLQELAQRYTKSDIIAAALALHTKAAEKWLKKHIITANDTLSANYHLMFAIDNNNMGAIDFLLQALPESILFVEQLPAPLELKIKYGQKFIPATWLIYAVKKRNLAIVKKLINAKLPIDARNSEGETALMCAAQEGDLDILKALLSAGANMNLENYSLSALVYAVECSDERLWDHFEIIKELLACGASRFNSDGKSPLHNAATDNKDNIILPLLGLGFDINETTRNDLQHSPLILSAAHSCYDVLKVLLTIPGIKLDLQDKYGRTSLHYTVVESEWTNFPYEGFDDQIIFAQALLKAGANPNIKDKNGKTPLDYAEEFIWDNDQIGKTQLIELFKSYGAKRGSEL